MKNRCAGVLCHPTSIYTEYGIGDLGKKAHTLVDKIKKSGLKLWQILPLGPTGYADSPYQSLSAFAGNPLLICPDKLVELELVTKKEVSEAFQGVDIYGKEWDPQYEIDYETIRKAKYKVFDNAFAKFNKEKAKFSTLQEDFQNFKEKQAYWLEDFVLFYTLKKDNEMKSWLEWPKNYSQRQGNALKIYAAMQKKKMEYYKFIQWLFDYQWKELKKYANDKGIKIIGDMPIFVAHDSSDVWCNRELFTLKDDGTLRFQAGVPPDYFSKTGQLWGNPLYNWEKLEENNFKWFIKRIARTLETVDWVRIDHFRGFESYWRVEGDVEDAVKGEWVKAPGKRLFEKVKEELGQLPIIAEDLGIITKEVEELRDKFNFPGMKVLQFAFSDSSKNPHLPHNYVQNSIVYPGTHDNDTLMGWWKTEMSEKQKKQAKDYLRIQEDNINEAIIKELFKSVANGVVIQMQDILAQGTEHRMNTPSKSQGNWQYITDIQELDDKKISWLKSKCKLYGRTSEEKQ